jgi:hypothetical protein
MLTTRERPEECKKGVRGCYGPAPGFPARGSAFTLHLLRRGSDLFGAEYVIVRKQGEIVIQSPSKTTRMFLKQAISLR